MKKIILLFAMAIIVSGCELKKLDWDKFIDENKTDKEVVDSDSEETFDTETPEPDTETPEIDHEIIVDEETPDTKNDEIIEVDEDAQDDELIDDSEPIEPDENKVDEEQIDESVDEDVVPVDPEMVIIPAGEFWMGCEGTTECNNDEQPYHKVDMPAYKIDKLEVTNKDYQDCVSAGKCDPQHYSGETCWVYFENSWGLGNVPASFGEDNKPAVCIDWNQAKEYCEWAGKRLPTEAEWEKAARGTDERLYPWGDEPATCEYSIMDDSSSGGIGCGTFSTWNAGSKESGISPYGLYDMSGNAAEWVNDTYSETYYSTSPLFNPTGPAVDTNRVVRGGSFLFKNDDLMFTAFRRSSNGSDQKNFVIGFRCAKSIPIVQCTGQTKCYNDTEEISCPVFGDFYGQDAQYLDKCDPRSYTISGTSLQEIVTDNNTGLQWQRTLPATYAGCTVGEPAGSRCKWEEAVNYCETLNYGGYEDWRLPEINELETLPDYGKQSPSIDINVFPSTQSDFYWSKNENVNKLTEGWVTSFEYGWGYLRNKTSAYYARCVRGDILSLSSFEESTVGGKAIVTDTETSLIWQKEYISNVTWLNALNYCETSTYAGFTDWRLPNINELKTLINHSIYNPASSFPEMPYDDSFWSSSSWLGGTYFGWTVRFDFGAIDNGFNKTDVIYARCVRNGE